jgi:hypothetical protein
MGATENYPVASTDDSYSRTISSRAWSSTTHPVELVSVLELQAMP